MYEMGRHIHARVLRLEKGCRIRVTHVHACSDCVYNTRDDTVRLYYASRFVRVIYSSHSVSIKLDTVTNYRRITWSYSKDSKYRNYNLSNSLILHHSWCGKPDSKHRSQNGSDFPSDAMLWIKEVEMVDSLDELKSSRSVNGKNFPNFEMLDAKIASSLNKIVQNSQFKKKVSAEEQKAHKR